MRVQGAQYQVKRVVRNYTKDLQKIKLMKLNIERMRGI